LKNCRIPEEAEAEINEEKRFPCPRFGQAIPENGKKRDARTSFLHLELIRYKIDVL